MIAMGPRGLPLAVLPVPEVRRATPDLPIAYVPKEYVGGFAFIELPIQSRMGARR